MARERGRSDGEPGEPSRSTRSGPISGMRCGAELRVREAWSEWCDVRRRGTLRVAGEARRGEAGRERWVRRKLEAMGA